MIAKSHDEHRGLDLILGESLSNEWAARAAAMSDLSDHIQDPRAFDRLVDALDDDNLAVVEAATDILLVHGGEAGIRELARAYATTDDNGTYSIESRLVAQSMENGVPVVARLESLLAQLPDGPEHDAAADLLQRLPPDRSD